MNYRSICFLLATLFLYSSVPAVKVAINSGNPVLPFPQFSAYESPSGSLGNLGTKPGVGVTHAEMEQTIRDAYQIQMNRAVKPGGGVGGIDYIYYRSNPSCSEGDGYGILGAAAMADKQTFDGLWLWIHDNAMNKVKRYSDCKESSPNYQYSRLPDWTNKAGGNSAADGDFDIALALLTAYYQWGEFMGIKDACGNQISYKQEAIEFLKALTDTLVYSASGDKLLSGDIGLDGYFKGGDSWSELTNWASSTANTGFTRPAQSPGPQKQYFDYTAPSYFKAFADFLSHEDSAKYAWNISQFRRAEASSDWLVGELYKANPKYLPYCGDVTMTGNTPTFALNGSMGEDFRLAWRTILNRMWNGNPSYSWNPATHKVESGKPNTFLQDMARRFSLYMWDSRQNPWNNDCIESVGTDPFSHWGPMTLVTNIKMDGSVPANSFYFLNWLPSVGSPSAVVSQDYNLMSDLYRYLEIEWDVDSTGDGYITSVPFYFHCWFRVLGLLVLSGNYHSPDDMKPTSNMKVYLGVDKTFAFNNDTITYTIDYRNYGSQDAEDVVMVDTLHKDFVYVSGTGGASYNDASHTVTWNIGTVKGFKTATGIDPTKGQVKLKVKVINPTTNQYRNKVSVSCSNGSGWTSNEFPNNITSVMERNYVDIAKRALVIDKKASATRVKPGSTVDFTIDFQNTSEAGWINGGRPGVHFSFALGVINPSAPGTGAQTRMMVRMFHDAQEAYIDYGNYRLSYFAYDTLLKSVTGGTYQNPAWSIDLGGGVVEGINKSDMKLVHENIIPGQDTLGKWNQRIIIQFSDPTNPNRTINLATIDRHLSGYRGISGRIHRGGTSPFRAFWYVNNSAWSPINWSDDWSYNSKINQDEKYYYFPITNDWSNPDKPNIPVNTWNVKACSTSTVTVNNILIEEWDGYTWRRIMGNGPMPGREANNVVIRDTVPAGFSFVSFTGTNPLGIAPKIDGNIISWSIPQLQIKQGGTISYKAIAKGDCPDFSDKTYNSKAWISADKESPYADSVVLTVSCDTVVRPPTPDHFDIVLDTNTIDPNNDNQMERVDLDAGILSTDIFVVIRDKTGLLLEKPAKATWTSRNTAIVTVAGLNNRQWQATITKVDQGSTYIVVSDPQNPSLKPDSCAVTAAATPPWPSIVSAKMGDNNGDIVPDMVTITLNNTFQVNQKLDSVVVVYRGDTYSFPASAVQQQGTKITVPITSIKNEDAEPTGQVSLIMTVEGKVEKSSKNFTDGVGPIITTARLDENVDGSVDTISLTFSEHVNTSDLTGAMLEVISKASGDTVILTINSITPMGIYSYADVAVTGSNGYRPREGDQIRFVPGERGQTCSDVPGNLPHLLNKPAVIKSKSPHITKAWYTDDNGDGIVKDIYMQFGKVVPINEIKTSVNWGIHRALDMDSSVLSYTSGDSMTIHIKLPDFFTKDLPVTTSGEIALSIEFTRFGETRMGIASDSAAPVISKAAIHPALLLSETDKSRDTLFVTFSENAAIINKTKPFNFISKDGTPYSMDLVPLSVQQNTALFLISNYNDGIYPKTDDSIWINSGAVSDTLKNTQNTANNRRVPVIVSSVNQEYFVTAGPNPFIVLKGTEDEKTTNYCTIKVAPRGIFRTGITIDATVSILDFLGNIVLKNIPMKKTAQGATFEWDGTNFHHRFVGTGTYLVAVKVTNENVDSITKTKIGVQRKK